MHTWKRHLSFANLAWGIIGLNAAFWFGLIAHDLLSGITPGAYDENKLLTSVSSWQLVASSVVCVINSVLLVSNRKKLKLPGFPIWLLMALGFSLVALDEVYMYHENLDPWIHNVFAIKETALSDRIDDFIVGIYCVTLLLIVTYFRHAFDFSVRFRRAFAVGLIFALLMVAFDAAGNREDVASWFVPQSLTPALTRIFALAEETFKFAAIPSFLIGILGALDDLLMQLRLAEVHHVSEKNGTT